MKKITLNDFTWGFELEGLFSQKLVDELENQREYDLELKDDGSVSVESNGEFEPAEYENNNGDMYEINEVAMGVFDRFERLQEYLAKFKNGKNYLSNDTCGLHIHIKPKMKMQLKDMCFDKDFILKIQEYSKLLCAHIGDRVANNHFCQPQFTFRNMFNNYRHKTKYAFMGNHPQGTIEFRFLSACEHKSQNVERFFQYFIEQLNITQARIFAKRTGLKTDLKLEYNPMNFVIYQAPKKINIVENIQYKKTIKICV